MNKKTNYKQGFFISLLILLSVNFLNSCKRPQRTDPNSFLPYISAYSSGIISKTSPIKIELTQDLGITHSIGKNLDESIIDNEENIKGDTYWVDSKTLVFKPIANLESGKTFHFNLHLNKLMKVPDSLSSFLFSVHTLKPNLEIESEGLKSYHSQKGRMIFEGLITTADYEIPSEVEKILDINFNGIKPKISWNHSKEGRTHRFQVDSLTRGESPIPIKINWNSKSIGKDSSGTIPLILPGIHEFKVLNTRALQDSEQAVLIQFSDPISKTQDLRGLIELSGVNDARFTLDGSEVKVFSGNPLEGNYLLTAHAGIKNQDEKLLGKDYSASIDIENRSPSVTFPGTGVILPSSGKLLVPFMAVNLKKVDIHVIKVYTGNIAQYLQRESLHGGSSGSEELRRVGRPVIQKTIQLDEDPSINLHRKNRFFLDMDKLIKTEPGAIYRIGITFRRSYAINICPTDPGNQSNDKTSSDSGIEDESGENNYNVDNNLDGDSKFWNFYNSGYRDGGEYDWNNRNNPCFSAYYNTDRWAFRNILASNLGLIVKKQDHDRLWIAVNDILTAKPLSGVELEVLDYQQQVIASGSSNNEGISELNPGRRPFLLIAKRGKERGYLKLGDENALSLSRFDIGGDKVQNGIKGFIYQERDVHRPGDSLFLSFIMEDSQNKLPELYPVNFELRNPSGQLVRKTTLTEAMDKFYVFRTKTDLDAPTGVWSLTVKVGSNSFQQDIRIETIMPNRLKIDLNFGGAKQLSALDHPKGNLKAQWLFGGTASKLTAKVDMNLISDGSTSFPHWDGYVFDDPTTPYERETKTVFDQSLDENGTAQVPLDLNMGTHPPGKLRAQFLTKVFEPGGAFSIHQTSIPLYFYSSFVGIKAPKGNEFDGGMLVTGKENSLDIVQLNQNGNLTGTNGQVELALYKLGWHWWWENNASVESGYLQAKTTQLIHSETLNLSGGKTHYAFTIAEKNWGRYLVLVKDLSSGHVSGKVLYIESPDWLSRAMEDNPTEASMLALSLDKPQYSVGDQVQVKIPSAEGGRALISLESGTKTIKSYWVDTKSGQTTFSFPATKEMAPNVFVHVSLLQGVQKTNDLPIRMYGVVPLLVENKETILNPKIDIAPSLKPETKASFSVSETNGKEMTYTVALVDEGLLDLTGFETPDPHKSFYSRESLGVKTFDLYDDVLGAWGGTIERILSIGGDANDKMAMSNNAKKDPVNQVNRFKPVVLYLGPYHLRSGETNTHQIQIPAYIGSLRVMVIAGHEKAYGKAETTVKIKKPLMLLATLPRVLAPSEELKLPVTVFGMEPWVKNATVSLAPNEYFDLVGPNNQTVIFDKPGDQITNFSIRLKNKTGVAHVQVTAKSGKEVSNYTIDLAVRNPNSYITQVYPLELNGGGTGALHFSSFGAPDEAQGYLEVSTIPSLNLQKRLSYLIEYPYGCAEQITSSVFPQLYLAQLGDLTAKQKADIDYHIKSALRRLPVFQFAGGGLSLWPGQSEGDEWATNYAGHFVIEAQKKGYSVPEGFLAAWKRYQRNLALSWTPRKDNFYGGDQIQAYRLYTLALAHAPELGAMNRLLEFKYLSDPAKWRLAAAYALVGNKDIGNRMIQNLSLKSNQHYRYWYYTFGSDIRDQAMELETLTLLGQKEKARRVLEEVASNLSTDTWYSTQETAYSLIAIAGYCGSNPAPDRIHYQYSFNGNSKEISSASYFSTVNLPYLANPIDFQVKSLNNNHLYIRVIQKGKPLMNQIPEPQNDPKALIMQVIYTNIQGEKIDPLSLKQGTDFIARVYLKNTGAKGTYNNMALSEIFPSGWEILNSRLIQDQSNGEATKKIEPTIPTYQDIRDDRILTFFNLGQNEEANFIVYLNATYSGHYYAPGIYCEAMYDASVHAGNSGKWIDIIPAGK